jgi:hydroxyethylthiazole kinase-like uncharacterized protein yjeF
MRYLPTGQWMQKADEYTINNIGLPSMVLMERAALNTVSVMEAEGIDLSRTLVVCGSGNNGGDGFAIARLLLEKGYDVTALSAGREAAMSSECIQQLKIAEKCGVTIVTSMKEQEYTSIVDALFGVGLNREITGDYRKIIENMNRFSGDKIAVDIPSGICSATGEILGIAFMADLTVTFACEKLGCIFYPGHTYGGKIVTVDIGISKTLFDEEQSICYTLEKRDLANLIPARKPNSHKGTYGKILMIIGSRGMSGAAYLSAKAAYTAGAGLVLIYTAEENRIILQQLLPEAIISTYSEYEEEVLKAHLEWADVVCVGCGLGTSDISRALTLETIKRAMIPCVLDADGLNILSNHLELLAERKYPLILTPHMLEMSRLLGCSILELQKNRLEFLREFTTKYEVICAMKDARTLVAEKDRQIFVNTAGNSSMAKAGSGDVLAGVIAALLAQGAKPYEAAVCGVYLHACGGDEAKAAKGSYSVLAQDLITGIGACLKKTEENMQR